MARHILTRRKEIANKQETLNKAKTTLKEEFIGIDRVIDEVVDALSSWYLLPDLQEKPVIINLWGLTGVGKTSLVNRLSQLLEFDKRYFHFDLGENDTREWAIKRKLEDIYENVNGYPVLLAFDEFQHARTLNDAGGEMNHSASRIIWQILDSGKFQISRNSYHVDEIFDLMQKLRYLLANGVRVQNGMVVSKKKFFITQMDLTKEYESVNDFAVSLDTSCVQFVPKSFYDAIYSLAREKFSTRFEVRQKLEQLNGFETLDFLYEVFLLGNSPKQVDCSKGLIFVLGNLDEAYTMSHNYNPDMDADEFHEQSLKINIPIIKHALKQRFRNEQIARLGNIHVIYPALCRKSFEKIIDLELSKIAMKVRELQGIKLEFDQSVHELIFREGVYPTQGTRPVFTTIHQIVNTKLGRVITEMLLLDHSVSVICFHADVDYLIADFYHKRKKVHSISIAHLLNLESLRKNKQDDLQAIIAVHESGHAIVSAILLKTVPEVIYSNTADVGAGGFVYSKFKWKYISRKEITHRLALYLGGLAAEKIIFGEENITTGAEEDIDKATGFITKMLKQCGMGKLPVAYQARHPYTRNYVYDQTGSICIEAERWITEAMDLAERTLRQQEVLLLRMADYLSDNRQMTKQDTIEMLKKYVRDFDPLTLIENGDLLFYRKQLKEKAKRVKNDSKIKLHAGTLDITLNMKTE